MPLPVSNPILRIPSTSRPQEDSTEFGQRKLNELRKPVEVTTNPVIKDSFNFDTPASMTLPYPGLDGHPRRITPIPISLPVSPAEKAALKTIPPPPSKTGWYWSELTGKWMKTVELVLRERLKAERVVAEEKKKVEKAAEQNL